MSVCMWVFGCVRACRHAYGRVGGLACVCECVPLKLKNTVPNKLFEPRNGCGNSTKCV